MSPVAILVALVLGIGAFTGGAWIGASVKDDQWRAKNYAQLAESSEAARKQEYMWQGVVNGTVQNYDGKMAGVRRNLAIALDGLRSRQDRPPAGMPPDARAACAGGTGAELSGADAGFLVREAARADELRAGLEACYAVIDGVRSGGHL